MSVGGSDARAKMMAAVRSALLVGAMSRGGAAPCAPSERTPVSVIPSVGEKARCRTHRHVPGHAQGQGATVRRSRSSMSCRPHSPATLPSRTFRRGGATVRTRSLAVFPGTASRSRRARSGQPADLVSLSHALGGAAETGTLFLVSGPENPADAELPSRHALRGDHGGYDWVVPRRCGVTCASTARTRKAAAYRQSGERAIGNGGHRADAHSRCAWSAPARRVHHCRRAATIAMRVQFAKNFRVDLRWRDF